MRKKKLISIVGIAMGCTVLLTACEEEKTTTKTKPDTSAAKITYQQARNDSKAYKLAFFENRITNSARTQYFTLGYYKGHKLVQKNLASDWMDKDGDVNHNNYFQEIIDPKLNTPYVVIKDGKYYIHRPPYSQYNQPLIKGKVTEKEK